MHTSPSTWCPHLESNQDRELRRLAFYPLNYRSSTFSITTNSNKRKLQTLGFRVYFMGYISVRRLGRSGNFFDEKYAKYCSS
jgi:hypothetical protein